MKNTLILLFGMLTAVHSTQAHGTAYCSMGPVPFEFKWSGISPVQDTVFFLQTKMEGVEKKNNNRTWKPFTGYELVLMDLVSKKKSYVRLPKFTDLGWSHSGKLVAENKSHRCLDPKKLKWEGCEDKIAPKLGVDRFVFTTATVKDSSDDVEWTEEYKLLSVKIGDRLVEVTSLKDGRDHYIVNCGD